MYFFFVPAKNDRIITFWEIRAHPCIGLYQNAFLNCHNIHVLSVWTIKNLLSVEDGCDNHVLHFDSCP